MEMLDICGPLSLFGMLPDEFSIAIATRDGFAARCSNGVSIDADFSFDSASDPDLLLIPGGSGTRLLVNDELFLAALKSMHDASSLTMSVCTGAALIAKAGCLDERTATTNKLAWDWATSQGSSTTWKRRARWVRDGDIYTSSGISAGMDMALAVIRDEISEKAAMDVARWAEYIWKDNPNEDPFA